MRPPGSQHLGSSAVGDVFPEGQTADYSNPDIGIFADVLKKADNISRGRFELMSRRH